MGLKPRRLLLACLAVLAGFVSNAGAQDDAGAPKRLALVIGNAAYPTDALPTAGNDAGLVAEALAQDGFDVAAVSDADAATLRKITSLFVDRVRGAGGKPFIFVYIAGHGVQYADTNYIVPVDVTIGRHAEVPLKAVPFGEILAPIEALSASAHVFALDLAHPNTIAKDEPLPLAPGLRHLQPPAESVYAFNAAPGMIGRADVPFYGIYARALAEALRIPGLDMQGVFTRVRTRVAETTGSAVIPWNNGELARDVPLLAARGDVPAGQIATRSMSGLPVQTVFWAAIAEDSLAGYQAFLRAFPDDPLSSRIRAIKAVRLEAATWAEACRADRPDAYWTYMLRYPRGPHYVDVRRRLAALHAALETPMRFEPSELAGLPAPQPDELRMTSRSASTFDDPAWVPPPPAPDELLPPPPAAFHAELAPPPLVPDGALPIPAPLPGEAPYAPIGRIVQPVAAPGPLTMDAELAEGDQVVVSLASDEGLITRTMTRLDKGRRTIGQTDAADEIVSWTAVGDTAGEFTITQSGPGGVVLSRQLVHVRPGQDEETVLTTGAGKLIAETRANARGRLAAVTVGAAKAPDPTFKLGVRASVLATVSPAAPVATAPSEPKPQEPQKPAPETPAVPETQGTTGPVGPSSQSTAAPQESAPKAEPAAPSAPAELSATETAPPTPMAATPAGASDTTQTATPAAPVPVRKSAAIKPLAIKPAAIKPVAVTPPPRPVAQHARRRTLVFQRVRAPKPRRAVRR